MRDMAPPNVRLELLRLKNFQRDTVDHVFDAMYREAPPRRRFLVADEVGLGKTMVARGVVARVVDHLWDSPRRIDIVYICSNASIARQNINRLNVMGAKEAALPSRITLLPKFVHGLKQRKLNFVSLTPQTSFSLRSSLGTAEERALLYELLPENWRGTGAAARNALRGEVERERFQGWLKEAAAYQVDEDLREAFRDRVQSRNELRTEFEQLRERFSYSRDKWPDDDRQFQRRVVGRLRLELATSCLKALEPDLIILDEFQRFKHLLDPDAADGAGALARDLFSFGDARVLMLSATPYKMFTTGDEPEGDDHFRDFVQTVTFLQDDPVGRDQFRAALSRYRTELLRLGTDSAGALHESKNALETQLRQVMVRTERLAVTPDRNGMLTEVPAESLAVTSSDVSAFLSLSKIARSLAHGGIIEYWKSSPYLLNFMDDYELKEAFRKGLTSPAKGAALAEAVSTSGSLLSWDDVERYQRIDPQNARLRYLLHEFVDRGAWQLLWLPPSLPYYEPSGPHANPDTATLTKRLIFSSWQVVPKVVSALVSYEVERRMIGTRLAKHDRPNTAAGRDALRARLTFSRSDGRTANMSVLTLLYPSISLAEIGDPLAERAPDGSPQGAQRLLEMVRDRLQERLNALTPMQAGGGAADERWYWAGPMFLDREAHPDAARIWFEQEGLAAAWRGDGIDEDEAGSQGESEQVAQDAWSDHVEHARQLYEGGTPLGPQPPDLADVLARVAIAGPAVAALRALSRLTWGRDGLSLPFMRNKAGWVAWGFRSLFNLPDVIALLEQNEANDTPFWRQVLDYCLAGNLQAVLDEYAHALMEWEGVAYKPPREAARAVAIRMKQVLQLRTANVRLDDVRVEGSTVVLQDRRMRARFAARFGATQAEEGAGAIRQDDVRTAFNSPFWPFVLCSTSVGQEGLDFHLYCHAVVHWNMPGNPVDLEQREGRVHRFKGHAVRKNAARLYGDAALSGGPDGDPWTAIFDRAEADRSEGASDLVPYWVLTGPDGEGARIERHVPALPLSRDTERAEELRRALTVYRMAFGQARQADLVRFLQAQVAEADIPAVAAKLRIDLAPRSSATPLVATAEERALLRRDFEKPEVSHRSVSEQPRKSPRPLTRQAAEHLLNRFVELRGSVASRGVTELQRLLDDFTALRRPS